MILDPTDAELVPGGGLSGGAETLAVRSDGTLFTTFTFRPERPPGGPPPPACGIGFELALLLPPLMRLRRGRSRAQREARRS